jgi:hypothetical protein
VKEGRPTADRRQSRGHLKVGPAAKPSRRERIGIGVGLAASPSHTTVRTGPYTAVRRIERTPVPAGGASAGVWKRASARMLRSLQCRAVGLHLSALACRTDSTACLPPGTFEMRVSTPHFQPFGPSVELLRLLCPLLTSPPRSRALRPAQSGSPDTSEISRGKTDRLRRTPAGFTTPILDGRGLRDHLLARPIG